MIWMSLRCREVVMVDWSHAMLHGRANSRTRTEELSCCMVGLIPGQVWELLDHSWSHYISKHVELASFLYVPGSNNDVTVLDRPPFVHDMLWGDSNDMKFTINEVEYSRYYMLADGIYPSWSCLVRSTHEHVDQNRAHYTKMQEASKKIVERCFGVLRSRCAIVQNPSQHWLHEIILDIMMACVIIHIMIIKEELENNLQLMLDIDRSSNFAMVLHLWT